MDKVNDVLRVFDAELGYEYLPEVLREMRQKKCQEQDTIIPYRE